MKIRKEEDWLMRRFTGTSRLREARDSQVAPSPVFLLPVLCSIEGLQSVEGFIRAFSMIVNFKAICDKNKGRERERERERKRENK